jgi:hypothetical protein
MKVLTQGVRTAGRSVDWCVDTAFAATPEQSGAQQPGETPAQHPGEIGEVCARHDTRITSPDVGVEGRVEEG